jgi:putative NIF3 family GTP cyclohydrolase 1 type 2
MNSIIPCKQVNEFIFSVAPDPKSYHDSENVYAWGDPQTPCTGVAVAWWPGPEILRQAVAEGLNLVVCHEDPIMELSKLPLLPHRSPLPETLSVPANRERMRLAVMHNLVIHRHHWNIDLAPWGIPSAFIEDMGWQAQVVLAERCLRIVELPPMPLGVLSEHVKTRLEIPFVRVASPGPEHRARRIGIAPGGSGQGWATVAQYSALGCDTVIVGDMIHGCAKMAVECGMAVLDGFHHATEQPGLRRLAARIQERFPVLPVKFFEEPVPWEIL